MTSEEADEYLVGNLINLTGYTSTSKNFGTALKFAKKGCQGPQIPVVFLISFHQSSGFFELTPEYSAYPTEQEVLVQDGL